MWRFGVLGIGFWIRVGFGIIRVFRFGLPWCGFWLPNTGIRAWIVRIRLLERFRLKASAKATIRALEYWGP